VLTESWFDSRQGASGFPRIETVRTGSRPTQWVQGGISVGVKCQVMKITTHIYLVVKLRIRKFYLHSPYPSHCFQSENFTSYSDL